jgi:hypothetical protein
MCGRNGDLRAKKVENGMALTQGKRAIAAAAEK